MSKPICYIRKQDMGGYVQCDSRDSGAIAVYGEAARSLVPESLRHDLSVASLVMSNLPEQPGYNGSILQIDDTEAERIVKALDAALTFVDQPAAAAEPQDTELSNLRIVRDAAMAVSGRLKALASQYGRHADDELSELEYIEKLLAERAPQGEAEPVAWMQEDGSLHTTRESAYFRGGKVTPLYAAQPKGGKNG